MTPLLVVLAIAVAAGGVVAVAAPNPRHAVLGGYGAAVAAALVGDPLPSPAGIATRAAGALLAGWLVWLAVRQAPRATERSALGLPGSAAVAMVAMVAGWSCSLALQSQLASLADIGAAAGGPAAALTAGSPVAVASLGTALALVVLAAAAVLAPRDGLRLGLGLVLLVVATELGVTAIGDGSSDAAAIAFGILVALTGAALAAIVTAMLRQPAGLALRDPHGHELVVRHRLPDGADQTELP